MESMSSEQKNKKFLSDKKQINNFDVKQSTKFIGDVLQEIKI